MIPKRLFFIATLCIVNVAVNTINDSEYDADGSSMESSGITQDSENLPNEGRIRICSSKICNRVCRVLKMKGKCVKKRCKCAGFITADTANDESENVGLNFKENVEESPNGVAGPKLDSAELTSEDRIHMGICHSNVCNRECRIVNLKGKCVKKRCICLPKANTDLS